MKKRVFSDENAKIRTKKIETYDRVKLIKY